MPAESPGFRFTLSRASSVRWSLVVVLIVAAPCALGNKNVEGDIILVNKLGSELILSHIPFQSDFPQHEFRQFLEGSLANFTPNCSNCSSSSPTILLLKEKNIYAVLSDKYLSILNLNGSLANLIPLGSSCHPLSLQPSSILPSSPLIIVCRSTSHQQLVLEGKELSLTPPTKPGRDGGIFVESGGRLYSVCFRERNIEYYDETAATYDTLPLPTVDCMDGSTLYALLLQPLYLLNCVMPDRTTLYVIRIQDGQVQAVRGLGRPVSTPDGEHFALIEGPSLQVFATNDLFIGSRAKTFDSDIVYHRFLTNSYLAIATEKGDHNLIDLHLLFNSSSSFLTPLPGGAPLASVWIHPDVYTYVSRGNGRGGIRLHSYNTTSGKAVDEKELPAVPDLLLFLPRQVKIEPTPPATEGSKRLSVGLIVGLISVGIVTVAMVVLGGVVIVSCARVYRGQRRRITEQPLFGPWTSEEDEEESVVDLGSEHTEPESVQTDTSVVDLGSEQTEPESVQTDTSGADSNDVQSQPYPTQATDYTPYPAALTLSLPPSSSNTQIQATDDAPYTATLTLSLTHASSHTRIQATDDDVLLLASPSHPPPSLSPSHPPTFNCPSSQSPGTSLSPVPSDRHLMHTSNELHSLPAESPFLVGYAVASTETRPDKEEAVP